MRPGVPTHPYVLERNADGRLQRRIRQLEDRVARMEREDRRAGIDSANPTAASAEGTLYGSTSNNRLWLRINGVWRYVALT
jgi:hypothetical protein